MVRYELPGLPYAYGDLDPFLDEQSVRIHHTAYTKEYVDGLNSSLAGIGASSHPQYISSILSSLSSVPEPGRRAVSYYGGGFENHRLFWEGLAPCADPSPGGMLEDSICIHFGGFDEFRERFTRTACEVQGSGWCWLVFDRTYMRLEIIATGNNTSPWELQRTPVLGLDLWEHAYHAMYHDDRPEYARLWWGAVDWDAAGRRFEDAAG